MLVNLVGQSSGSFIHALTAGLMSVGEKHGPIQKARDDLLVYGENVQETTEAVQRGIKIYGFGNSFFKIKSDPCWVYVHEILIRSYPDTFKMLATVQEGLQRAGKKIYPNPAGYSAAAAHATGLIRGMEEPIFVIPRMHVWLQEYVITQTTKGAR
jgi:citrate synthase